MKIKVVAFWTLAVVFGLFVNIPLAAAGPYDGLWMEDEEDFYMIRSVDDTIILVNFGLDGEFSLIFIGVIDGNTITLQTVHPDLTATVTATIHSSANISFVVTSCSGNCEGGEVGTEFTLTKLF